MDFLVLLDRRGGDLLAREADVDLLVGVFARAGLRPRGVEGLGALRADALVVTIVPIWFSTNRGSGIAFFFWGAAAP